MHELMTVKKLETGIDGFDHVSQGGLPQGRTTLIAGSAGSAKSMFAVQFLVEGIEKYEESGLFIAFEESTQDIRNNMSSLGWDIEQWEKDGKWTFIDAVPQPGEDDVFSGNYDLGGLLARIENIAKKTQAKRVSIDSLDAVFARFKDKGVVRRELHRVSVALKSLGITAVLTAEREEEYGSIARYGVEAFVADNVIILRNILEEEKRRRTIEILKYRGATHQRGEYPFTIIPEKGIVIIPLSAIELQQRSSDTRISSGSEELDRMCGGGFFRDSIILVSGATGTGKTLASTEYIKAGVKNDEKVLLFAFEESREQLFRNATGWGVDFRAMEEKGLLKVVCTYPEVMGLEDHLIRMRSTLEEFKPNRVAIDSLSALERVSTPKGFREFVIGLTSLIKHMEVAGMFTATTPNLMGGSSVTEAHISTITDSIILLRYVEMYGEMRRGITVLKMRGSMHEKAIREFTIDSQGMHIGNQFRDVVGILAGSPTHISVEEMDRLDSMFKDQNL